MGAGFLLRTAARHFNGDDAGERLVPALADGSYFNPAFIGKGHLAEETTVGTVGTEGGFSGALAEALADGSYFNPAFIGKGHLAEETTVGTVGTEEGFLAVP